MNKGVKKGNISIDPGQKQFQISVKVPWRKALRNPLEVSFIFDVKIKETFGYNVRTNVKLFNYSATGRFVVVFDSWRTDTDRVCAKIRDIAIKTLQTFMDYA